MCAELALSHLSTPVMWPWNVAGRHDPTDRCYLHDTVLRGGMRTWRASGPVRGGWVGVLVLALVAGALGQDPVPASNGFAVQASGNAEQHPAVPVPIEPLAPIDTVQYTEPLLPAPLWERPILPIRRVPSWLSNPFFRQTEEPVTPESRQLGISIPSGLGYPGNNTHVLTAENRKERSLRPQT